MALTYEGAKMFFTEGFLGVDGRYAALHTGAPTVANECSWSGYSRRKMTTEYLVVEAADDATNPSRTFYDGVLEFVATGATGSQTPTHVGVWKLNSSGSGDALLSSHALGTAISAPGSSSQVNLRPDDLWWDFDVANSPLTREGVIRGMAGDGLVHTVAGLLALFSDAAMTTKLSGNGYADISGVTRNSWNITSAGVLRQGTARSWPAATGNWLEVAACGFMVGDHVMFGVTIPGGTIAPLASGGQYTVAENTLTLTIGGLIADVTVS